MTTGLCVTESSWSSCSSQGAGSGSDDGSQVSSAANLRQRRPWQQYFLKSEKLPESYGHPYPKIRAYDRQNQRSVIVEMIPRECILKSIFPLKRSYFLERIGFQHPSLATLQDIFYCTDFGCECLVYDFPSQAQTLAQVLSKGRRFDAREARIIFRQIVLGVKYLLDNGYHMDEITVDDILFWEEKNSDKIRIQIMYLKFTHARIRQGSYGLLEPPETIFQELQLPQHDKNFLENKRMIWHLGVLLYQTCTTCNKCFKNQTIFDRQEYMNLLEEMRRIICNQKNWESDEQQQLIFGLTALSIDERWNMREILQHSWLTFGADFQYDQISNFQLGTNLNFQSQKNSNNSPEFLTSVRRQLTRCVLDRKNNGAVETNEIDELIHFNKKYVVPALEELVSLCYEKNAQEAQNLTVSDKIPKRMSQIWQKSVNFSFINNNNQNQNQATLQRCVSQNWRGDSNFQKNFERENFYRTKTEVWQLPDLDEQNDETDSNKNSDFVSNSGSYINSNLISNLNQNLNLNLEKAESNNLGPLMTSQFALESQNSFEKNIFQNNLNQRNSFDTSPNIQNQKQAKLNNVASNQLPKLQRCKTQQFCNLSIQNNNQICEQQDLYRAKTVDWQLPILSNIDGHNLNLKNQNFNSKNQQNNLNSRNCSNPYSSVCRSSVQYSGGDLMQTPPDLYQKNQNKTNNDNNIQQIKIKSAVSSKQSSQRQQNFLQNQYHSKQSKNGVLKFFQNIACLCWLKRPPKEDQ